MEQKGTATMENGSSAGRSAAVETLRQQLNAACSQMADSQLALKAACDEFDSADADAAQTPDQMLRLESGCRSAGMSAMRLTTGYLTALTAYSRALHPERPRAS